MLTTSACRLGLLVENSASVSLRLVGRPTVQALARRTIWRKPRAPPTLFSREDIDARAVELARENAPEHGREATLDSSLSQDLRMTDFDKFGYLIDLGKAFDLNLSRNVEETVRFSSAREAATAVAGVLESQGRLLYNASA